MITRDNNILVDVLLHAYVGTIIGLTISKAVGRKRALLFLLALMIGKEIWDWRFEWQDVIGNALGLLTVFFFSSD